MKYICLMLAVLLLQGLCFAQPATLADSAATDTAAVAAPVTTAEIPQEAEIRGAMGELGTLLKWFIYALLGITLLSGLRILMLRKRQRSGPDAQPRPGQSRGPGILPAPAPGPALRRLGWPSPSRSYPFL